MSALYPSLTMQAGESLPSLVSRLSLLHRSQSTHVFSLDMGFRYQQIIDGNSTALSCLASLSGVPLSQITHNAIVRQGDHYSYRGEKFIKSSLRRRRSLFCPCCLQEDLGTSRLPWHASGRNAWLFHHTRVCLRHHVRLMEISLPGKIPEQDFPRRFMREMSDDPELLQRVEACSPTELEIYLDRRLEGERGPAWLDSLPFYAAWKACEIIGMVATRGRRAGLRGHSDQDSREAGAVGFAIAKEGHRGVQQFLHGLWTGTATAKRGYHKAHSAFGTLYLWLYAFRDNPDLDGVREPLLNFMAETAPVGPDDLLFDKPYVSERRTHSLLTAHRSSGIHPCRLRRVLRAAGVIGAETDALSDNAVTFSVATAAPVIDLLQNTVNRADAGALLGVDRFYARHLAESGIISPVPQHMEWDLREECYCVKTIEAMREKLLARAALVKETTEIQLSIAAAAMKANCSRSDIVKLVLDDQLRWVGRKANHLGIGSLVVDLTEVVAHVRSDADRDLTFWECVEALGAGPRVVHSLTRNGILPATHAANPRRTQPCMTIPMGALRSFKDQYISLHDVSRAHGRPMHLVRQDLLRHGINPALSSEIAGATYYLRSSFSDRP
ncbi:TniQ family protein [Bosea sp. (in: a-proteobacteria)]|uniref:TniQ family protein n=1 Tax=Bosea sp. (in: a-proteobacteria) TaxID=1871050 RepID=UPI0027354F7F|nr:TniQ family protein [Bosea sp. (in: a-proteobacteria)]MDP3256711.1 TniQ family protein [Bosea sp. (in: a-proteobacteria)]